MTRFPRSLSRVFVIAFLIVATTPLASAAPLAPTEKDVSYGSHPNQVVDLYLPTKGKGPYPVVVWFGGIWKPAKNAARPPYFLEREIAVVAVQTRTMNDAVADKVDVPVSYVLDDACRVVQFLRAGATKWKLDPERIGVGGGSQGALPALYVGCSADRADANATDPVARASSRVTCVAAYRCQPTIDPRRMQVWVAGVKWGAPALGMSFDESLKRRDELQPLIAK